MCTWVVLSRVFFIFSQGALDDPRSLNKAYMTPGKLGIDVWVFALVVGVGVHVCVDGRQPW